MTRRRRYSLFSLFVVLTVACVWLGLYSNRARRQKCAVDAIGEVGGEAWYTYEATPGTQPSAWRRKVAERLGDEWAYSIDGVWFYPNAEHRADEQVKALQLLPEVEKIAIWPGADPKSVRSEVLNNNAPFGLTDQGAEFILQSLPKLKHLSVTATELSDEMVDRLLQKPGLTSLQISRNPQFGTEHVTTSYMDEHGVMHTVDQRDAK